MKTIMLAAILVLSALVFATAADARPRHHHHHHHHSSAVSDGGEIVDHPAGCPRVAFCGCGASIYALGRNERELWLASAWYKFSPATAASGMAAVWRHHVAIIIEAYGDGTAKVYDANSGGHQTRIHRRSLAGASIRDPHSTAVASAGERQHHRVAQARHRAPQTLQASLPAFDRFAIR